MITALLSNMALRSKPLILTCALTVLTSVYVIAQIGFHVSYTALEETEVGEITNQIVLSNETGLSLGFDYWFRLKQKRIEFLPTVFYTIYNSDHGISNYGLRLSTSIYPFDFNGDCNCPTFSKQNDALKKGFFIRLSPGISHWRAQPGQRENGKSDAWIPELTGSVGVDFGITNLITISPEIRLRHIVGADWTGDEMYTVNSFRVVEPSIRLGMRFDKKNYGFKRWR